MKELLPNTNLSNKCFKSSIAIVLTFLISFLFSASAQTLVWEENFDLPTVNANKWTYDFGNGSARAAGFGWGNSELEYYTSRTENVNIESGNLVITALKENFDGSAFTSGRVKTEGRVHFKYGTVEARIKLPNMANGLWPAFWTLGTVGGSWPSIGEIDMMEAGSAAAIQANLANKKVSSAAHWSDGTGAHQFNVSYKDVAVDLSADYHLYKMVWTSQAIKMYIDNVEYYNFDISGGAAANLSEFHNPHYLLLNLAVGGAYTNIFDGNAITATLPGKMYVDYIRLYQNPGDEIYFGSDYNAAGNIGVLTETTPVSKSLNFGTDATLNYWNNLTNIANPVAFEGTNLWAVHANAGDWFGMGIVNDYLNLKDFSAGSLKFQYKSSYAGQFKIGLTTGHGETWINFAAGTQKYGLVRDGNWHEVTIPMADFDNPGIGMNIDLYSVKSAFMFAGDPASSAADFYFDNVYFYKAPSVVLTEPLTAAPTPPARAAEDVVSLFSDAYTNVAVDFAPAWSQSTVTEEVLIQANKTKKYTAWNYQGMVTSATDLSAMTKLHLDVWSADCTDIEVYLLGPGEPKVTKALIANQWNSIDIDLSAYGISLASITGLKLNGIPFDYPVGNKTGFIDNVYFYKAPVVPAGTITAAPTPPARNAGDVISLFSGAYTDVAGTNWFPDWGQSTVVTDTTISGDATKKYVNFNYQGVTFAAPIDASGMNKMHIDIWTPNTITFDVYPIVPGQPEVAKSLTPTVAGWNSFDIDLATIGTAPLSNIIQLKFVGTPSGSKVYLDNIYFYKSTVVVPTGTITAAPTPPARNAGDVISLFSGAYTDIAGTDWFPNWGQNTVVSDTTITGDVTKKYVNFNYQGVQFASAIDASGMNKLHIDIWTPNTITFDVYPIVPGQPEVAKSLTPTVAGWNSFDIDLATIGTTPLSNIIQLKFVGTPSGSKVYLDNIYFYKSTVVVPSGTITAAPTPPVRNSVDVISLFSGAYTDVAGTDWFPNWGQSTVVTDTTITGDITKKYVNFNYQGVQFATPINASAMTHLHLDIWTPNTITFDVFPIVPGQPEVAKSLTPTVAGWNSFDIELATIGTAPLSNIIQLKFVGTPGGSKVYLDNIYFYKPANTVVGVAPTVTLTAPANNAQYTEPATVNITATAADADGTVSKVEFFNGTTLLGTDVTSPYSFDWTNVAANTYSITAKVTDNDNNVVASTAVSITVSPVPCTGTAVSGDYSYEVYTNAGTVYFKFIPLAPIAGSNLAILYLKEGGGGYGGYGMTASGSNFIFSKAIANGVNTSFYFTYNTPPAGERNSSADPHSYYVGTTCTTGAPTVSITSPLEAANFTAPASITINATAADANGITQVDFYNGATLLGTDNTSPYSFDWTNVAAGNYSITAKATNTTALSTTSTPVNIVVNAPNLNGYCGTAFNGDYEYKASTSGGIVTFRFHPLNPIAGCLYAIINLTANAAQTNGNMIASGTDFIYSMPLTDGTITSFYFTYNTPPAGENNSSSHKHEYVVGTNCMGITGTTPLVNITSPVENDSYTEPGTVNINATASDLDGTVTKVEFYSGSTYLGMDDTSPYSFSWTNVAAGNYIISAKATDNDGYSTISNLVNIVVNINNTGGFCETLANGDYSYKAETVGGNVVITFHPLAPIAGCNSSLIYIREGLSGGYPGYQMTKIGADFRFTKAIASGTPISIYFTYNTPPSGERNSSATPHSYTVGDVCLGGAPTVSITSPANAASYLEPANITFTASAADANGTVSMVEFYNGTTLLGTDNTAPYSFDWTNVPAGSYTIRAKATDNSSLVTTSAPVNITVNVVNANGYCGTAFNGDYEYKVQTNAGTVTFTFHPLAPIAGCNLAILYLQEGGGGYPGYSMTASGSDFTFSKPIADGVSTNFYFTYNTPPAGERNSSANPHSYTVGAVCFTALPISIINYAATKQLNGQVALTWTTSFEQNNDHFVIERSTDGRTYLPIGTLAGNNNSTININYKLMDISPVVGRNFYRLLQVDKDGKTTIVGIKSLNIVKANGGISIYPNPLKGTVINVSLADVVTNKLQVRLLTISGKLIYSSAYTAQGNSLQINLPYKPAAGLYLLHVEGNAPVKLIVN